MKPVSKQIKIAVVDDHNMFLEGLISLLKNVKDIKIVGAEQDSQAMLNLLDNQSVDIALIDISLKGMGGIKLNRIIKKRHPQIKTLMLTAHNDPEKVNELIKDNINGYILKSAKKKELLLAINEIAKGEKYFSTEVIEKYTKSIFHMQKKTESSCPLSKRELEILALIVSEYTTQEISEELFISQHTVNSHRKNLLAKLGLKNTAGMVKYALKKGLVSLNQ